MFKINLITSLLLLILLPSISNFNTTICKPVIVVKKSKIKPKVIFRASIYRPSKKETDSNPLETASMSIIDTNLLDEGKLLWVAISRNLHKRYGGKYDFGDKIILDNCGKFSNKTYIVKDLMAEQWLNKIDILISKNDTINYFFKNIKIKKL